MVTSVFLAESCCEQSCSYRAAQAPCHKGPSFCSFLYPNLQNSDSFSLKVFHKILWRARYRLVPEDIAPCLSFFSHLIFLLSLVALLCPGDIRLLQCARTSLCQLLTLPSHVSSPISPLLCIPRTGETHLKDKVKVLSFQWVGCF